MRIAHVRGQDEIKLTKKQIFDKEVDEFTTIFIAEHNRKIEKEKDKLEKPKR